MTVDCFYYHIININKIFKPLNILNIRNADLYASAWLEARQASASVTSSMPSSFQDQFHERAVRIFDIVAERTAFDEPVPQIERAGRCIGVHRAGFEADPGISPPYPFGDDVPEHEAGNTPAPCFLKRMHRLYLAVGGTDLLQRAAPDQRLPVMHAPEADVGRAQSIQVQGMTGLRG